MPRRFHAPVRYQHDDPRLRNSTQPLSWRQRILDLRHATGWDVHYFASISQLDLGVLRKIENGHYVYDKTNTYQPYHPTLATIRRIRRMEALFAHDLTLYRENPPEYDRLGYRPPKFIERFDIYRGYRTIIVHRDYRTETKLPPIDIHKHFAGRPGDLKALGGVLATDNVSTPATENEKQWRDEQYRRAIRFAYHRYRLVLWYERTTGADTETASRWYDNRVWRIQWRRKRFFPASWYSHRRIWSFKAAKAARKKPVRNQRTHERIQYDITAEYSKRVSQFLNGTPATAASTRTDPSAPVDDWTADAVDYQMAGR